jgi:hypothetical protein
MIIQMLFRKTQIITSIFIITAVAAKLSLGIISYLRGFDHSVDC